MHPRHVLSASAVMFACALFVAAASCRAKNLPAPEYTSHPTSALVEVPFPPPPARVENIPKRPNDDAVWIDGEWQWQARRWAWKPGRWMVPPPNARFAPWTSVRDRIGTLYVAAGVWRDSAGNEVPEPESVTTAKPAAAAVVDTEGEPVPPSRIVRSNDVGQDRDASTTNAIEELDAAARNAEANATAGDAGAGADANARQSE